jgi:hypothetical protein
MDDEFEILAFEVKGSDPKYAWEIAGIYRAPNEDTGYQRTGCPNRIFGVYHETEHYKRRFKFTSVDWKGVEEGISVTQDYINRFVWDSGYTKVVENSTRGGSLLGVYLVRPESELISCDIVQGVSDHCGVCIEMKWRKMVLGLTRKISTSVPQNKVGLQNFLGINYQYGRIMVATLKIYGIISRQ